MGTTTHTLYYARSRPFADSVHKDRLQRYEETNKSYKNIYKTKRKKILFQLKSA